MEYMMVSDMSPAGRWNKFSSDNEDYELEAAPKKATGNGISSALRDRKGSRQKHLPDVAYHIEHLHLSPRGLVGVIE